MQDSQPWDWGLGSNLAHLSLRIISLFPPSFLPQFGSVKTTKIPGLGNAGLAFKTDPFATFTTCQRRIISPMCIFSWSFWCGPAATLIMIFQEQHHSKIRLCIWSRPWKSLTISVQAFSDNIHYLNPQNPLFTSILHLKPNVFYHNLTIHIQPVMNCVTEVFVHSLQCVCVTFACIISLDLPYFVVMNVNHDCILLLPHGRDSNRIFHLIPNRPSVCSVIGGHPTPED